MTFIAGIVLLTGLVLSGIFWKDLAGSIKKIYRRAKRHWIILPTGIRYPVNQTTAL